MDQKDKLAEALELKVRELEKDLTEWANVNGFGKQKFRVIARSIKKNRPKATFEKITDEDWEKILALPWDSYLEVEGIILSKLREIKQKGIVDYVDTPTMGAINKMLASYKLPFRAFHLTPKLAREEGIQRKYRDQCKLYKVRID